ncbi:hypothetical protein JIN85_08645 [Luteolibacter pohnpeiensis]|uniref:O-antigen ligase domain-containing protein n=1 Tax=Luteolibacter pohnpeiensis TaxID=454153 RepID=A0A934S7Z3_9BACT|nr:hypothetical protein [Luteolibacter pohnpeiensis]MBK1882481.1 hypothetical protein [Luteolibacter pohnpeiensis]
MNSRSLTTIFFGIIGIIIALWSGISILMNPTGGIAGLSKLITIVAILVSIVNPKAGLFALAAQAIYTDQIKRIGVYYGAVSMTTVQEILIGPILTICALNFGLIIQLLFGKIRMTWLGWSLYGIGFALSIYYLSGGAIGGGSSFAKKAYNAAVAGAYTTVVPLCYALFKDVKDWIKFLSFQVIIVVPSAAWAIWQYFHGFNNIEWTYAMSGLSPVHTSQMLMFENPRVFGFFGSASALGCLCIYVTFAVWRAIKIKESRCVFAIISVILFIALVFSTQRSALLSPFIFGLFIFFYRTPRRTFLIYSLIGITFIIAIYKSNWLLNEGIGKVNSIIANNSTKWGSEVLKVSTFSDRLRGWERLGRADSWTLFGTNDEGGFEATGVASKDYSHDMINRILIRVGAVGLGAVILVGGAIALNLHRLVWRLPKGWHQSIGVLSLGITVPICLMSAAGGDNFTTTPYNLAIWSAFAGAFVVRKMTFSTSTSDEIQISAQNTQDGSLETTKQTYRA